MRLASLFALLFAGCAPALVANQPRTVLLGTRYEPALVRDAVARALNHRRLTAQAESEGQTRAVDTRHTPSCTFDIAWSDRNLTIHATQADAQPSLVDPRCLTEADLLARAISKEVERPQRVAAKNEQKRQRHELAVERAREGAEQAALAREQLEQQAANAPPPPGPMDEAPPVEVVVEPQQPAAGNNTVYYQQSNSVVNSQSNTTVNHTVINAPPPVQAQAPQLNPFLCCRGGQPYVCPNVNVYAAVCVKKPAELANFCKLDPGQAPYCRR